MTCILLWRTAWLGRASDYDEPFNCDEHLIMTYSLIVTCIMRSILKIMTNACPVFVYWFLMIPEQDGDDVDVFMTMRLLLMITRTAVMMMTPTTKMVFLPQMIMVMTTTALITTSAQQHGRPLPQNKRKKSRAPLSTARTQIIILGTHSNQPDTKVVTVIAGWPRLFENMQNDRRQGKSIDSWGSHARWTWAAWKDRPHWHSWTMQTGSATLV